MSPRKAKRLSREDWIAGAVSLLAEAGVEGVRVEVLARKLGVTKGSFYWHFKDRAELLEALVGAWEEVGTQRLIDAVDAAGGSVRARVTLLWQLAVADDMAGELALREWARQDGAIAARVKAVDDERMAYLRRLFGDLGTSAEDVERRAMLTYSLLIGSYFIQADHPTGDRQAVLDSCLASLTTA